MTSEKTGQTNGREESGAPGRCSPQAFAEMMAQCGPELKCDCGAMMQAMMKGGCCRPKQE